MYKINIKVKIQLRYPRHDLKNLQNADFPLYLFLKMRNVFQYQLELTVYFV